MGDQPRTPISDFYSILGISKSASVRDICKAYKSMVKKWHPDKNPLNKSEAEANFKAINEAYKALNEKKIEESNVIRNHDRRETTPTTAEGLNHRQSVDDSFFSIPSFFSRSMSRKSKSTTTSPTKSRNQKSTTPRGYVEEDSPTTPYMTPKGTMETEVPNISRSLSRKSPTPIIFSQSSARRKPPPIERKLECTLEELYRGCVKNIKITRDVINPNTGITEKEEEILRILVKPGWKKGTKITFERKGDEKPGHLPADIIFFIDEKRHPLFEREGDDLEIVVEVPLVQALTGCSLSVPLLGGENMNLSFSDIIFPGYEKVISGQGMPNSRDGKRGELRIRFLVTFPEELSDEQRSEVYNILQDSC